jgi:hypothetical protein
LKTNSTRTRTVTTIAAACVCILLGACSPQPTPAQLENAAFKIESGPEEISSGVRLWVVKHKESGQRFVFAERSSGGIVLTPLNP